MSEAIITALEIEIAEAETAQEPTREQIAALQAQLAAGDETIARNRAAIALLKGEAPVPNGSRRPTRPRSQSTAALPSPVSRDRVTDFLGANGESKAGEIADAVGVSGPALTRALGEMVAEGVLTRSGEKRGTKYALKVG